jgi:hypothetical protein
MPFLSKARVKVKGKIMKSIDFNKSQRKSISNENESISQRKSNETLEVIQHFLKQNKFYSIYSIK